MAKPARYYKRRRALPVLVDGVLTEPVEALTTRYYFGLKRRKPHNVYYHGGTWYRTKAVATSVDDDGKPKTWTHAFIAIDRADAADRFTAQTLDQGKAAPVTVHIRNGKLESATGTSGTVYAGLQLLDGSEPLEYVEELLDLTVKERKRPGKAA